jgi:hypothetical protein
MRSEPTFASLQIRPCPHLAMTAQRGEQQLACMTGRLLPVELSCS